MRYDCLSVLTGWQTRVIETGELIGPAFNTIADLWAWQRANLPPREIDPELRSAFALTIHTVGGSPSRALLLAHSYMFHRQFGGPRNHPANALTFAHKDVAEGKQRFPKLPRAGRGSVMGAKDADGLAWCEDTDAIGLRFVCFADNAGLRSISHSGWYTNENGDNDSNYRGAVYQFPGRNGRAQYVAGYRVGSESGRNNNWSDMNAGSARLDLSKVFEGQKGGADRDDESAMQDAARRADSIAEGEAESDREYEDAWQAGSYYERLGEDATAARKRALSVLREFKKARAALRGAAYDALCDMVRDNIAALLESIQEARAKRDKLIDEWCGRRYGRGPELESAFREGASLPQLKEGA